VGKSGVLRRLIVDTGVDGSVAIGAGLIIVGIIGLIITIIFIVAQWVIFTKAEKPGWASIIPIYNIYVLHQIIGRPAWWLLLYFAPPIAPFVALLSLFELGRAFGKSDGFNIGLALLGFIFIPILAFDNSRYQGPNLAF
jgi:Family of unknown function (DUF5684)